VSTDGGAQPQWRRDGKELFYISIDRKLMAVNVQLSETFAMAAPTPLFQTQVARYEAPNRYGLSNDGQRFLVNTAVEGVSQAPITVVLNWTSTLRK
jgi:hypothetical protein